MDIEVQPPQGYTLVQPQNKRVVPQKPLPPVPANRRAVPDPSQPRDNSPRSQDEPDTDIIPSLSSRLPPTPALDNPSISDSGSVGLPPPPSKLSNNNLDTNSKPPPLPPKPNSIYSNTAYDVHWWEYDALYGFDPATDEDPEAQRREKEYMQTYRFKRNENVEEWRAYEAQNRDTTNKKELTSSSRFKHDDSDEEDDPDDGQFEWLSAGGKALTARALTIVTGLAHPTSFKKLVRKGVPPHKRAKVWMERSGALNKMRMEGSHIYPTLVASLPPASQIREEIEMDIARTFSMHLLFATRKTKDMMLRILLAYSVRNPQLGYCQNMTCIVGVILFFLPEEEAFWLFASIMEDILPADFCSPTLIGLRVDQKVLDVLIQERLPKLHAHFVRHHVELSCFTTAWLLRLFVDVFPLETTLRVWDCFLNEGSKILFRVALAFLKINEDAIRSITQTGELLMFLNQESRRFYDADRLIKTSHSFWTLARSHINLLRNRFIQEVLTADNVDTIPGVHVVDDEFVVV
eukprot:TRINITY_DN6720_c0_g1_i2.p1 TRINITY_DN6720_c0_g1~~TRINITY_DN6720_c0_g1_i2.p1  ORF type:complete len:519 (-),score=168.00 TRINITY_DN6720_c0_g1_i2:92-1648(-)